MKASKVLRSLSLKMFRGTACSGRAGADLCSKSIASPGFRKMRIPGKLFASPMVSPLPAERSFDELVVSLELYDLRCRKESSGHKSSVASFLLDALDSSIATQKTTLNLILSNNKDSLFCSSSDGRHDTGKIIDDYIDDNTQLLDTCNALLERIATVNEYVETLGLASHRLEGKLGPNEAALARARDLLESCRAMEVQCGDVKAKLGSSRSVRLNNSSRKQGQDVRTRTETGLDGLLTRSVATASVACQVLRLAFSFRHCTSKQFKIKQLRPCQDPGPSMLREVKRASMALRDQLKSTGTDPQAVAGTVTELKRACEEVEKGIGLIEDRVKDMYKSLISIRMALWEM